MIFGVGTDVIEIERVRAACRETSFLTRIFSEQEQAFIGSDPRKAADNFAAKEAVVKAFGTGFSGIDPRDIEVLRKENGAPCIALKGSALQRAEELGAGKLHISISNTDDLSTAFAVCETADEDGGVR